MNFLQIVQRAWLETGGSGTSPGPSTVIAQVGDYARLVVWANAAWQDIQTSHKDWGWARASASFVTVAQQPTYALGTAAGTTGVSVATFGEWARDTARNYITATGTTSELNMACISYDGWRERYQFGGTRVAYSRPVEFAIGPAKQLCLGPVPLAGYTVTLDYFTAPVDLALDADTPALPAEFHMLIVWKILMMYGAYEAAPEVYQRGELEFSKLMARLTADRLPEMTFAGALA